MNEKTELTMPLYVIALLESEIEARVDAMAATGDISPEDRRRQALEDIIELDPWNHAAYTKAETKSWNVIRRAALATLQKMNALADDRSKSRVSPRERAHKICCDIDWQRCEGDEVTVHSRLCDDITNAIELAVAEGVVAFTERKI